MESDDDLASLVHKASLDTPEVLAIHTQSDDISYKELNSRALAIASVLIEKGAKDETIGILGQRNITSCIGIIGTIYAGCSYTPINTKYPESRVQQIIDDSSIRYVIGRRSDIEIHRAIYDKNDVQVLLPSDSAVAGEINCLGQDVFDTVQHIEKPINVDVESLAYILYTSGSTGVPKGVQVTHSNVTAFLHNLNLNYPVPIGFRSSQTFDLSFDLSVCDMFFTWTNSGTLCLLSEEEKLLPSEYIRREKIYFWYSVPTLASIMNRFGVVSQDAFPSLKYSLFCGEPLTLELAEKWSQAAPNSTVENVYGPTEATIHLTRRVYTHSDSECKFSNSILPIGKPFSDHVMEVVDEQGARVEQGTIGQLVFKGPQITKGYLHDIEKTKSSFVEFDWDPTGDIWYKSGDLGFNNAYGDYECLGRLDSQIKIAGRRVELGEIENVLRKYPQLADVCVTPVRNKDRSVESLVAFTTSHLSDEEKAFIRSNSQSFLESIFYPSELITINEFPTTDSGKIDRNKLLLMRME